NCAVIKQSIHKTAPLRAKLIQEGTYADFMAQQHLARAKATVGTQPFIDYADNLYRGEISIGIPPQNFSVMLDTGSTDTWVIDARCTRCPDNSEYTKNRFNSSASSTFTPTNTPYNIPHISSGMVASDVLNVAGLVAPEQGFGLSTDTANPFGDNAIDGVLGLGWPAISIMGVTPPMQNILSQLDLPLFTVWLDRHAGPREDRLGGLVTYGALDNMNCEAQVDYVQLSSLTYWQFPIQRFSIGSHTYNARGDAISDTGSAGIGAPASVVAGVISVTGAKLDHSSGLFALPCNGQYPDMIITIGGRYYTVPSEDYVIDYGNGKCYLAVYEIVSAGFGPSWVLGDSWIRANCNVYDIGQKRIGY
ncbi:hypothetical protein PENTCL1PPCAC_13419, partial [Pristionchus entomophagus]